MKLSTLSHTSIAAAVQKALQNYASKGAMTITDFYFQPNMESGELVVFNDDDQVLAQTVVEEWKGANPEDFYSSCEISLKRVLNQLSGQGELATLSVIKPYSFVLVDNAKETVAELLLVDDDETMLLNDELLKGLDEELNAFLKDLLEK